MPVSRRQFFEWSLGATGALAAASLGGACAAPQKNSSQRPPGAGRGDKQTLLILGGTGFLGPHIVETALARGFEVTLFNRGKTNPHLFPDLEKLRGDRDGNLDALAGRSFDAVIDTSGYVPRIVRASTELLAPRTKQYVFISTISVYANYNKHGITEDHPLETIEDKTNEDVRAHYGALKALCEQAAESVMPGRVTNIRPGLIVGPRDPTDRFTYWPVRIARGGEVLAPGDGSTATGFIDVRDLADWTVHTVQKSIVGVYNAVGPKTDITVKTVLDACKRVSGSDATFAWADAAFLKEQSVAPWMQMPLWIPAEGDYIGFGTVSRQRAIANGLQFRSLDDTVKATLAWFRTLPAERQQKLRAGLPADKERDVLAAWRARPGTAAAG